MARFVAAGPPSVPELVILVVSSTALAWLVFYFRLPGGLMFGAMTASAILHGGGFIHSLLPWWVAYAGVVGIGAVTGSRFANTDPFTLLRFLGAALGSFAVAMTIAALSVLLLTTFMSVHAADAVLAFAPGAQDTMMVLSLALHLDPVFVGALQLSRFLMVSFLVPFLAQRIRKLPKSVKAAHPAGATRPEVEDTQLDR
jgi:membrane AbrB-like protein